METKSSSVFLGREAFLIIGGEVVRTRVAKLRVDDYEFLNGLSSRTEHWFSFNVARAALEARLQKRRYELSKEMRNLRLKGNKLSAPAYKEGVMTAALKVVDLRPVEKPARTRKLKKVVVPSAYYQPGELVYTIVIPDTEVHFEAYRPHPYFVLEVEVSTVCFTPNGRVHYTYTTPFVVSHVFGTLAGAKGELRSLLALGDAETVHFVSASEEKTELKRIRNVPF